MAFTYGFYNSINGDRRYDAQQMSAIFDGIITDGVFSSVGGIFATVPGEGMTVVVKSGRAWFDHTWSYNDGAMPLSIDVADVTMKRYDAVVLEVNNSEAVRENAIKVVKGTPATNPVKPGMTNTETIHQHPLAYVLVDPGVTSITADKIDIRVGKSDCPFSTAILQTVSIDDLFNAWESEFDQWFSNVQAQLEGNIVTNLQKQIDDRVKISDKATSEDLASATPNKWVDAAGLKEKVAYTEIARYDKAGAYTWTAPDYFNGNDYTIGVCVVGGGAGGYIFVGSSSSTIYIAGGASGIVKNDKILVKPGQSCNLIVGAGGAKLAGNINIGSGYNGGSSSFLGIIANGGLSYGYQTNSTYCMADGGDFGDFYGGHFGGRMTENAYAVRYSRETIVGNVFLSYNLFAKEPIVGSGSGVYAKQSTIDAVTRVDAELNPKTNLGGGYGLILNATKNKDTMSAGDATANGCGGGSLLAYGDRERDGARLSSGRGGDGLVIIYLEGSVKQ